jgi:hypothetical protein
MVVEEGELENMGGKWRSMFAPDVPSCPDKTTPGFKVDLFSPIVT